MDPQAFAAVYAAMTAMSAAAQPRQGQAAPPNPQRKQTDYRFTTFMYVLMAHLIMGVWGHVRQLSRGINQTWNGIMQPARRKHASFCDGGL